MAGTENYLNHVLSTSVDSEHEIPNFCHSRYIDMSEIQSIFQHNYRNSWYLRWGVNAKFNDLYPIINNLASQGQNFGAICLQETWTSNDSDWSLLQLPGYQLIHQGSKCTKHGGLIIYLNENYSYEIRNLYNSSNIWEGIFIDINGGNLCRTFTIGNIYRPPRDNNNNINIQQFISELLLIIEILQNINLLQISKRDKIGEFFDLMCTNYFSPKITFPTRFARHSFSLIDPSILQNSTHKTCVHFVLHNTESIIRSPALYS